MQNNINTNKLFIVIFILEIFKKVGGFVVVVVVVVFVVVEY